jgi:hypothetical protein
LLSFDLLGDNAIATAVKVSVSKNWEPVYPHSLETHTTVTDRTIRDKAYTFTVNNAFDRAPIVLSLTPFDHFFELCVGPTETYPEMARCTANSDDNE